MQDCKPFGTGWDFSQDYIGIGYCGIESDYSFIYDLEILNHLPGPIFFLYREDWGVTNPLMANWWGPMQRVGHDLATELN